MSEKEIVITVRCGACGREQWHTVGMCEKCSNPECDWCLECKEVAGWDDESQSE